MTTSLIDQTTILSIVYEAIDVLNQQRSNDAQLIASPDLALLSDEGLLDSLALTTLVLTVERKVRELTGREVDIFGADVGDNVSMLRTPMSLANAVLQQLSR